MDLRRHQRPQVAVAITTRQNVANVLPALHFRAAHYIALESPTAARLGWGTGAREVLRKYLPRVEIRVHAIPEAMDPTGVAREALQALLPFHADSQVLWILGGGQKPQQMGLWLACQMRRREGRPDLSVYANPERGTLTVLQLPGWWTSIEDRALQQETLALRSRLKIADIVQCNAPELVLAAGSPPEQEDARKAEERLWTEVRRLLSAIDPPGELFVDVARNIEAIDSADKSSEHDVLLATSAGTLLSLDSKSGIHGKRKKRDMEKDWHSRQVEIRRMGGVFSEWVAVIDDQTRGAIRRLQGNVPVLFLGENPPRGLKTVRAYLEEKAAQLRGAGAHE